MSQSFERMIELHVNLNCWFQELIDVNVHSDHYLIAKDALEYLGSQECIGKAIVSAPPISQSKQNSVKPNTFVLARYKNVLSNSLAFLTVFSFEKMTKR